MISRRRLPLLGAAGLAALTLTGCTIAQDVLQVGQREFTYETAADADASRESFRFQGFLPEDATDVRLLAQLDGHAAVMRWTSPTSFTSAHCVEEPVTSEPDLDADWSLDPLPPEGLVCGSWTVVQSGDLHLAWRAEEE